jgi:hypothetical protein
MEDKRRYYVCVNSDAFFNEMKELAFSAMPLAEDAKEDSLAKPDKKGKSPKA